MLTPEQLDQYPEAVVELFAAVEQDIIADMARRVCKTGLLTDTARWQFRKAKEMGLLEEYILQELSNLSRMARAEIKRIFEEAGEATVAFDDRVYEAAGLTPQSPTLSPALKDVIAAGLRKTNRLYKNLTKTIANTATKQFEDALDHAYLQVTSGAFTPQLVMRQAVRKLAANGMQSITYPSGHRDHMDVAIRRALLTGLNQTCAEVQLAHANEMGSDLVQVTSHLGARPTHAVWQGRIFSLSGKHPKFPDFVSSTGYGTGAGLCGWNCAHSFYPFFEGFSIDNYERYDEKENNRVYAESQQQRAMERRIRKDKRECAAFDAAGLRDDFDRSATKLKQHESQLRDFLRQTGRTRRKDREQVLGFGRSQSSKAVWVQRNAEKAALNRYVSGESYVLNAKLRAGVPLSKAEQQLADDLDRAILKLPKFEGTVYRSMRSQDLDDLGPFNASHQKGNLIVYDAYTSTGKTIYDDSMDIQLIIKSKSGRDLKGINDAEREVLFGRGTTFKVIGRDGNTIWLEEG